MDNKKYKINESRILFTELGEEGVIFDIKINEYFSLNETYCAIFKALQKNSSIDEIVNQLIQEYEVDEATCKKEVSEAISTMISKKIVYENSL